VAAATQRRAGLVPRPRRAEAERSSARVLAALSALPAQERHVLVLTDLLGLPVPAVAAEVGRTDACVRAELARGRHRLVALLQPAAGA
jgi:DNA-directed RNA polymerase specialized sigma24 family protein